MLLKLLCGTILWSDLDMSESDYDSEPQNRFIFIFLGFLCCRNNSFSNVHICTVEVTHSYVFQTIFIRDVKPIGSWLQIWPSRLVHGTSTTFKACESGSTSTNSLSGFRSCVTLHFLNPPFPNTKWVANIVSDIFQ